VEKILDRTQLERVAINLCLLSRNPLVRTPLITVADNGEGLMFNFEDGCAIQIIVFDDDDKIFLVFPRSGIQAISKQALMAGTN